MTNRDKLHKAFVDALGVPPGTNFQALAYRSIPEWDSVAHMQLVNEIETAFDIMLPTQDVIGMSSYAVACEIVVKHGVVLDG